MRSLLPLTCKLQVLLLVLATGSWNLVNATHFRYGHIVWNTGSGNTINFTIQNAWRRNDYGGVCVNTTTLTFVPCTGSDGLPAVGDVIVEFIGDTRFFPGDASTPKGSPFGPL